MLNFPNHSEKVIEARKKLIQECRSLITNRTKRIWKNYPDFSTDKITFDDPGVWECISAGRNKPKINLLHIMEFDQLLKLAKPLNLRDLENCIYLFNETFYKNGLVQEYIDARAGNNYFRNHLEFLEITKHSSGIILYREDAKMVLDKLTGVIHLDLDGIITAAIFNNESSFIEQEFKKFYQQSLMKGYDSEFATSLLDKLKTLFKMITPRNQNITESAESIYKACYLTHRFPK